VWSYAAFLETFFRLLVTREPPRYLPKVVSYGSGGMSAEGRSLIKNHFGLAVLSNYSAVEALKLAFLCEESAGFHIHEDLCDVRLLDPSGMACGAGDVRRGRDQQPGQSRHRAPELSARRHGNGCD